MRKKLFALMLTGTMMMGMGTMAMAEETTAPAETEALSEETENDHVKMAVQMYNFLMGGDWGAIDSQEGVTELVKNLADAGYEGLEWCNFQLDGEYLDLAALKETMDEVGLETNAMHYHYDAEDPEGSAATVVERTKALGCDKLIFAFSKPSTFGIEADEDGNWTPEQVDQWVDEINTVITTLKAAAEGTDIEVLYHNHATEMLKGSTGEYAIDMIECDGKEIDVYWMSKGLDGKVDTALEYVSEHADEIELLHVKDGLDGSIHTGEMCGWGKGTYDIQKIVDVARENESIEWVVVENDNPANFGTTGLEDAIQSADYAKANINFVR